MKQIGIIGLVAILILFGSPLIKIKDTHQNMEYQEIGDVMLSNVNSYVKVLETTSNAANKVINFVENTIEKISKFLSAIADFIKEDYENKNNVECDGDYTTGFTCGNSEGGGGGSFGGR